MVDMLQDAIQDARYLTEVISHAPRPSAPMVLPSSEEAYRYVQNIETMYGHALEFERIIGEPLGYYLFKEYLRREADASALEFLEEVQAFSVIETPGLRLRQAAHIKSRYLGPSLSDSDRQHISAMQEGRAVSGYDDTLPTAQLETDSKERADGSMAATYLSEGPRTEAYLASVADGARHESIDIQRMARRENYTAAGLRAGKQLQPEQEMDAGEYPPADKLLEAQERATSIGEAGEGGRDGDTWIDYEAGARPASTKDWEPEAGGFLGSSDERPGPTSTAIGPSGDPYSTTIGPAGQKARSPAVTTTPATEGSSAMGSPAVGDHSAMLAARSSATAYSPGERAAGGARYGGMGAASTEFGMMASTSGRTDARQAARGGASTGGGPSGASGDDHGDASAAEIFRRCRDDASPILVSGPVVVALVRMIDHQLRVAVASAGGTAEYDAAVLRPAGSLGSSSSGGGDGEMPLLDGVPSHCFDTLRDTVLFALRERFWPSFRASIHFDRFMRLSAKLSERIEASDFELLRVLGRGGFGTVHACKRKDTGKLYAMKKMSKHRIRQKGAIDLCWNERLVLGRVDSPFVVSLKYAFQDNHYVYLILDCMTGGDLSYHLQRAGRFSEDRARFYAAQVLLGIEHLHSMRVMYRDLKPENLLLDERGHCRISDMGLATHVPKHGYLMGRCGTRGYMPGDMLVRVNGKRQYYTYTADFWSYGCVLYEFIYGKNPFRTEQARALHRDRHRAIDLATLHMKVSYDSRIFSKDCTSLLQGLLERDPGKRLGANGIWEIKDHPWFDPIDWGLMESGQLDAPFVPDQNINAASQDAIVGREGENESVSLDDEENRRFEEWEATNLQAQQAEFVEFLMNQEQFGGGMDKLFDDKASLCCTIS